EAHQQGRVGLAHGRLAAFRADAARRQDDGGPGGRARGRGGGYRRRRRRGGEPGEQQAEGEAPGGRAHGGRMVRQRPPASKARRRGTPSAASRLAWVTWRPGAWRSLTTSTAR